MIGILNFVLRAQENIKGADILQLKWTWPTNSAEILELLYLETSLVTFSKIYGYSELKDLVANTSQAILQADIMLPDCF